MMPGGDDQSKNNESLKNRGIPLVGGLVIMMVDEDDHNNYNEPKQNRGTV